MRTYFFVLFLTLSSVSIAAPADPCLIPGEKPLPGQMTSHAREMESTFNEAFGAVEETLTEDMKKDILNSCQSFENMKSQKAKDKLKAKSRELYDLLTKEIGLFSGTFPKLKTAYSKLKERKFDFSIKTISPLVVFTKDLSGDGSVILVQRYDFCRRLRDGGSGMLSETLVEQAPQSADSPVVDNLVKTMACSY